MAYPTFVGKAEASGGSSVAVGYPAGTLADDVCILLVASIFDIEPSVQAGWTLIQRVNSGANTNADVTISAYWRRLTEPAGGTVVVSTGAGSTALAILAYRGVRTSGSPLGPNYTGGFTSTAGTSHNTAGIVLASADSIVIHPFAARGSGQSFSGYSNATLDNLTERLDFTAGSGFPIALAAVDGQGTTSPSGTTTATSAVSGKGAALSFSLVAELPAANAEADIEEGAESLTATGTVLVSASAALAEGVETLAAAAVLPIAGAGSIEEAAESLTAAIHVERKSFAAAAIMEAAETVAAALAVRLAGQASIAEGQETLTAGAVLPLRASAAILEVAESLTAAGEITKFAITPAGRTLEFPPSTLARRMLSFPVSRLAGRTLELR